MENDSVTRDYCVNLILYRREERADEANARRASDAEITVMVAADDRYRCELGGDFGSSPGSIFAVRSFFGKILYSDIEVNMLWRNEEDRLSSVIDDPMVEGSD